MRVRARVRARVRNQPDAAARVRAYSDAFVRAGACACARVRARVRVCGLCARVCACATSPTRRPSAAEALEHPYFADVRDRSRRASLCMLICFNIV